MKFSLFYKILMDSKEELPGFGDDNLYTDGYEYYLIVDSNEFMFERNTYDVYELNINNDFMYNTIDYCLTASLLDDYYPVNIIYELNMDLIDEL